MAPRMADPEILKAITASPRLAILFRLNGGCSERDAKETRESGLRSSATPRNRARRFRRFPGDIFEPFPS
jgi:hypothetical protein